MARSKPQIERTSRSRKVRKVDPEKSGRRLAFEETNGTVVEVFPKLCHALLDGESKLRLCTYRRSAVFEHDEAGFRLRTPVAVGDRIKVLPMGGTDGVVEGVAERRNRFYRSAPGRERVLHILAANLDVLVIVASTREPDFTPGVVDRFLVAAQMEGLPIIIALNKVDLVGGVGPGPWDLYRDLGVNVLPMSVKRGEGIDALRDLITGRTAIFSGHSGVGKTSLLRSLLSRDVGKIGDVNEVTTKGKHTTTSSQMYFGPGGSSRWIDTPGVRAFGLEHIEPERLITAFPEFGDVPLRRDYRIDLPESELAEPRFARYESYLRILESMEEAAFGRGDGE